MLIHVLKRSTVNLFCRRLSETAKDKCKGDSNEHDRKKKGGEE